MTTQNVVIGANTNPNEFKCIIYEAATPNTVVQEHIVPLPHTSNQLVSFTGLNVVTHVIRTYEWVGGSLGTLIHEYIIEPTEETISTEPDIELNVGTDIIANSFGWDGIVYPQYFGKVLNVDYRVEQRGVGRLKEDEAIDNPPFGFLLNNGALFNDGDTFFIHWFPKLVVTPAAPTGINNNGLYTDIIEVSSDANILVADANKLFDINITADIVAPILTLDAIANISNMKTFSFKMDRGLAVNAVIKAQSGEIIYFNGQAYNEIYLGQNEYCTIVKKNTAFHVASGNINYNDVGNVITTTSTNRNGYTFANGSLLGRNTHPRLYNIHVANLSIGNGLISESNWSLSDNNKTNFTLGDSSTDFRVPDYRGLFPRFFDGGRGLDTVRLAASTNNVIGNFQDSGNKQHDHEMPTTRDNNTVGEGVGNGIAVANTGVKQKTLLQGQTEVTVKNTTFYAMVKC